LEENKERSGRKTKEDFLLQKRVRCGECGAKMITRVSTDRYKERVTKRKYYECRSRHHQGKRKSYAQEKVDKAVWGWIEEVLSDKERLQSELDNLIRFHNEKSKTIQEQVEIAAKKINEFEGELDKLVEVLKTLNTRGRAYAVVMSDIECLESTIEKLEAQKKRLTTQMNEDILSGEQQAQLLEYAERISKGLIIAGDDRELRERVVEMLDVEAKLAQEEGETAIYVSCVLGSEEKLSGTTRNQNRVAGPPVPIFLRLRQSGGHIHA
jgi:hypothetical protein